jgi:hypothetical protein
MLEALQDKPAQALSIADSGAPATARGAFNRKRTPEKGKTHFQHTSI